MAETAATATAPLPATTPARTITRRLRQAAAASGLVALAIAALLSGSDRQSREFPNSPSLVGWPYDTGAARAQAIFAFVKSGPKSAIPMARRAILSDPISAQPFSLLGRAQLYAGQAPEARKTFQVAGQLGWRDAMTQIYWLDQAVQTGDIKIAAERLDALLRQNPRDENRDRFLAVVSATPEGRAALAERLKALPTWTDAYVRDVKELPPEQLAQRVDVVRRTGRSVWTCKALAPIAQKLIDANMLSEAQAIWRSNCATSASLVYDGSFDQLDTTVATPGFDWQLTGRGDVDIRPTTDTAGNPLLDIKVTGTRSIPVLSQLVVLQPGTYRLSWFTPETPQNTARNLMVSLSCINTIRDAVPGKPVPHAKDQYAQTFTVDAKCPTRKITFWLEPNNPIKLDSVTLQKM